MALFLLDTDICSYAMKRRSPPLQTRLIDFAPGELKVSVITVFELRFGACRSPESERIWAIISAFLSNVEILNFDQQAAQHAASIRAELEKSGQKIGSYDLLIAAHARAAGATVITNNVREFGRVAGLAVENWTE